MKELIEKVWENREMLQESAVQESIRQVINELDAGKIRVLRSGDNIEDYDKELSPIMGNMFIFKVTDNCWHGHLPLAAKRRAIMVNYMASPEAYKKHHNKHKRSARFKKLRSAFARKN
jgi:hypothetical protein